VCAACSIISVLTQWGATLVIKIRERERERERENLGEFAPKDVVAPRSDGVPRTAKYQAALEGEHDVLVLISEVWAGFSPEAMRFLGELAPRRGTTASTSSARARRGRRRPSPPTTASCSRAGGAVGGRDRDRAGDQEERELLECARRTRDSSTGTPYGGVKQRIHGC